MQGPDQEVDAAVPALVIHSEYVKRPGGEATKNGPMDRQGWIPGRAGVGP